eukprot:TRINITY_DN94587_c0_g1_i1.p2 TRINITY_DN94587_c0_g1~~TRINITY_DN94587_c0_g1_i1.p2  ORF type:complete len:341 (+),score=173.32 TRINITY_DN94587_c0_g1_i1:63-1085(+)
MSDRKQINKYYPPDYDPSKGSLNTFVGQHPLRERANKLHLGILVVRFEMPYNVWCEHCNAHIGKGVRYNAQKRQIGTYYSTKVWEFSMPCHLCHGLLVVRTDPKNADYVMHAGVRRQAVADDAEEAGVLRFRDEDHRDKLQNDVMYRLEHRERDRTEAKKDEPRVLQLQRLNKRLSADSEYDVKRAMRNALWARKRSAHKKQRVARKHKLGDLVLTTPHPDDVAASKAMRFKAIRKASSSRRERRDRRMAAAFGVDSERTIRRAENNDNDDDGAKKQQETTKEKTKKQKKKQKKKHRKKNKKQEDEQLQPASSSSNASTAVVAAAYLSSSSSDGDDDGND